MNTQRIKLINCDESILTQLAKGDSHLSDFLNLNIPEQWTEFGATAFQYALIRIQGNPEEKKWWTYLPIIVQSNTLIGSCGYKGAPNEAGVVEIGYEVARRYRNQGFATEIASLLVEQAFAEDKVKKIQAHTLAEENASTRVLEKCGFVNVEELEDEEDGMIWRWALRRR